MYAGEYEEDLAWIEKAIRLDPVPLNWYLTCLGVIYMQMGKHWQDLKCFQISPF